MRSEYTIPPMVAEGVVGTPLPRDVNPGRILVLRFHAFGDTIITLPVLAALRRRYPDSRIELVTSDEYASAFRCFPMLDGVHSVNARLSPSGKLISLPIRAGRIIGRFGRPDLLIDLQRSRSSRLLARMLRPRYHSAFDRFAPDHALQRYLDGARAAGADLTGPVFDLPFDETIRLKTLKRFGLNNRDRPLVCLNPAGCWETKHWPFDRYIELGKMLVQEIGAKIVLIGTENVRSGAAAIAEALGEDVIDLTDRTTIPEAIAIVRELSLMVSDDSALMHVAWTAGIPTVAIFGASRSRWSSPVGPHTRSLGSEDLECGACMMPICTRGDRLCLVRVTAARVLELCREVTTPKSKAPGES